MAWESLHENASVNRMTTRLIYQHALALTQSDIPANIPDTSQPLGLTDVPPASAAKVTTSELQSHEVQPTLVRHVYTLDTSSSSNGTPQAHTPATTSIHPCLAPHYAAYSLASPQAVAPAAAGTKRTRTAESMPSDSQSSAPSVAACIANHDIDALLDAGKLRLRSGVYSESQSRVLTRWFLEHVQCPYPSAEDKEALASATGLSLLQIRHSFTNLRKRHWTPIVEGRRAPRNVLELTVLQLVQAAGGACRPQHAKTRLAGAAHSDV